MVPAISFIPLISPGREKKMTSPSAQLTVDHSSLSKSQLKGLRDEAT